MSGFSEQLKELISHCGASVGQLAERSGLSPSMLYKIQSGTRVPDSVETLERLLDAAACALPQRKNLIRSYLVERIGTERYLCFQSMKDMLADMAAIAPMKKTAQGRLASEIPSTVTGSGNVNAAVQTLLAGETMRPGGSIQMMVPLRYGYCFECMAQVLADCPEDFGGICHLFSLRANATGDALLYNMRAIRMVLPRMLTLRHYEPRYCYLSNPDDGTVPFPYFILSSKGVLLLSDDFQSAVFLRDPEVLRLYRKSFRQLSRSYAPILRQGSKSIEDYLLLYRSVMERVPGQGVTPIVLSAAPCIVPCVSRDTALRLFPDLFGQGEFAAMMENFFSLSERFGHVTFFTLGGLRQLIETGELLEIQGADIPRLSRDEVLDALEEMLRRARAGNITPYVLREELFPSTSKFCMGLYGGTLVSVCEIPGQDRAFSDITEATLAQVLRDYTEYALLLEDVFSREESILMTGEVIAQYRTSFSLPADG